ncbi:MAG: leucine-rich repeat protein [Clostridia bacterium]|nr:leucine-rich repeat protein [Clostridia bacterium]
MSYVKRIISLLLTALMLMSLFAGTGIISYASGTVASGTCHKNFYEGNPDDYIEWVLDTEGTLTITGHGKMVQKEDMWSAFWEDYDELIKKVVVGEGIRNLSSGAFSHCQNLTEIQLPDTLENIESRAFICCNSLVSLTIPENVSSVDEGAFAWCENLEEIVFLSDYIRFRDGDYFAGCSSLKKITLPEKAEGLYSHSFKETALYADESNWKNGNLIIDNWLLAVSPELTGHYILPENVTSVVSQVFKDATGITSVSVPDFFTEVPDYLFYCASSLENVEIPSSVTRIGKNAFYNCTSLRTIELPKALMEIDEFAFSDCSALEEIWLPENLLTMGRGAFSGCSSLKEVIIPESVTYLADSLFSRCTSMESVVVLNPACETGLTYKTLDDIYNNQNGIFFIPVECEGTVPENATAYCTEGSPIHVFCLVVKRNFSTLMDPFVKKYAEHWNTAENDSNITFDDENNRASVSAKSTVDDIAASVEGFDVTVLTADGKPLSVVDFVGTGCRIQLTDENSLTTVYDILVPSDIDGNGKITAADARLSLRAAAKIDAIDGIYEIAADANSDKKVTAADARIILRKAAGLE